MAHQFTLPPLVRGERLPMTSDEFDAWVPDGMRAEWVDGKGMIFASTGTWHGLHTAFLGELVRRYCLLFDLGQTFLGPVEVRLPSGARFVPAIFVVLTRDLERVHPKWVDGPPGFAIEFVSEHSVEHDRVTKLHAYEGAGVAEYLLIETVDRERDPEYHRVNEAGRYERVLPDDRGRYHSLVMPGFWFHPDWFRQEPLPDVERLLIRIAGDAYWRYLTAIHDDESGG
ncbi:MAG: hypothetical protein QOF33_1653 [Thermomicrobiales bacterium]|jgi:Uma2 family endonuclease|nr:hypothetical protein [Thermomicrobiales bacterium]